VNQARTCSLPRDNPHICVDISAPPLFSPALQDAVARRIDCL